MKAESAGTRSKRCGEDSRSTPSRLPRAASFAQCWQVKGFEVEEAGTVDEAITILSAHPDIRVSAG